MFHFQHAHGSSQLFVATVPGEYDALFQEIKKILLPPFAALVTATALSVAQHAEQHFYAFLLTAQSCSGLLH